MTSLSNTPKATAHLAQVENLQFLFVISKSISKLATLLFQFFILSHKSWRMFGWVCKMFFSRILIRSRLNKLLIPRHVKTSIEFTVYRIEKEEKNFLSQFFFPFWEPFEIKLIIYFLMFMNYVWRMRDKKERTARASSRPSRSWSNKKLVCFSNYSLLDSSLCRLHLLNRLIIIGVGDGDLICSSPRSIWQIIFHSFRIGNEV